MQSDFASTFAHSGEVQFLESREGCTNDSLSSPNYSLPSSEHEGSSHSSRDLLKICVKMGATWSAQVFRQTGVTQSGPGAFFLFCFQKTGHTSSSLI